MKRILLLIIPVIILSCSNPSGSDSSDYISSMDIVDASSLFINAGSSLSGATRSASSENTLFKITEDGYVEEVRYYDEEGNEISYSNTPVYIQDIDDSYIAVLFGYDEVDIDTGYLVRKSDGSVFNMGNFVPEDANTNYANMGRIQTDSYGNLYFLFYDLESTNIGSFLRKISTEDPENLTSEQYTFDTDHIWSFSVDQSGNVIYWGCLVDEISIYANRIQKANGGFSDIPYALFSHWIGLDGNLYISAGYDNDYTVQKIVIDENYSVSMEDYGSSVAGIPSGDQNDYQLRTSERIAIYDSSYPNTIYEVYNASGSPKAIDLTDYEITNVVWAFSSDNYYYIAGIVDGSGNIAKINPADGSMTKILPSDSYSILSFTVNSSDQITFNALRYSDGAKIIGSIDAGGVGPYTVNVVEDAMDTELVVLEKIN